MMQPRTKHSIYTDAHLKTYHTDPPKDTLNALLKNLTATANSYTWLFVPGFIDMCFYIYRYIYMTSSGMENFNTISVAGDRNIIKNILVNTGHGEVIFDQTVAGTDYLDGSRQTLFSNILSVTRRVRQHHCFIRKPHMLSIVFV
jgi:hypothetical protein